MSKPNPFLGPWRIIHMEGWDQEYVDLVVPGFIRFDPDEQGEFQFGTVRGFLDTRIEQHRREQRIEFSWIGESDTDLANGRGWAVLEDHLLIGRIYIHGSDDSEFTAKRVKTSS